MEVLAPLFPPEPAPPLPSGPPPCCPFVLSPRFNPTEHAWRNEVSVESTVPPAIVCALEASGYEDAIRNAVSLGGDADTLACITGDVAEALYGLPRPIDEETRRHLDDGMLKVTEQLYQQVSRRA